MSREERRETTTVILLIKLPFFTARKDPVGKCQSKKGGLQGKTDLFREHIPNGLVKGDNLREEGVK